MRRLRERIAAVGPRRCTVLIHGETGTGKELVARRIHATSRRAAGPFVPVDCTTLPQSLLESQLFGHVRGAFTGAAQDTVGFIRAADGGTLFLDEIGDLPGAAQAKLLRCLQERTVTPVGSVKAVRVNVRVVAATHRDLASMVGAGAFREDLYYRLNVAQLGVPPLRQRIEDVPALVKHCLADLAELYEEPRRRISGAALAMLGRHTWPGNVRELNNAVEHAFVFCRDRVIEPHDLPASVCRPGGKPDHPDPPIVTLNVAERRLVARALRTTGGNQIEAAKMLGVERHRLRRMIVRHGLEPLTRRS